MLAKDRQADRPTVLLVDDNRDVLIFLEHLMTIHAGWRILTAQSVAEARQVPKDNKIDAALLDYLLLDGTGVQLGLELRESMPQLIVVIMSGMSLPADEEALCEEHDFAFLSKPFLASDLMNQMRFRLESDSQAELKFTGRALRVFFSYSHRDEKLRDRLDAHLSGLKHMDLIHSWHDRKNHR